MIIMMMITMIQIMLIKIILPLALTTYPKGEAAAVSLRRVRAAMISANDTNNIEESR